MGWDRRKLSYLSENTNTLLVFKVSFKFTFHICNCDLSETHILIMEPHIQYLTIIVIKKKQL